MNDSEFDQKILNISAHFKAVLIRPVPLFVAIVVPLWFGAYFTKSLLILEQQKQNESYTLTGIK